MKLTDVILKEVPVLSKNRPILDALEIMNKQDLEGVCVGENGKIIGSVTYRDMLFRIGAQRLRAVAPESLYISGVMHEFPTTVSNDTSIRKAAKLLLELRSSCLPMFYGETYLGLIYKRNMLKLVQEKAIPISSIMRKNYPIVRPNDRIIHARKLILETGVPALPVINEDGRLLGMLGQGEALNALVEFQRYVPEKHQKARIRQLNVSSAMKVGCRTVEPSTQLSEAAQLMLKEKANALLVTESAKLVGILTPDEVLEYMIGSFAEEQ